MCFLLIAGKEATKDGSVLFGANNDWPGYPGHIRYEPKRAYAEGAGCTVTNGKTIPQVRETCAYTYTTTAYETGTRAQSWIYGMNENQVTTAMVGVYSFRGELEAAGLEADDLTILVLERGKTARQSVEMLGALIQEYGFGVSSIEGAAGSAVLAIADPKEGYFLEIVPGGHWVAKRVPDHMVAVRPNCFGIQDVDFSDPKNFLWSEGIEDYAVSKGWYDKNSGKSFNFYEIFSDDQAINDYGKASDPVNALRRWRALDIIVGEGVSPDVFTYEAIPNRKLGADDVMKVLRDSLEETDYDLARAPEAGPHQNPFWMEISPSIAQAGTVLSMVAQLRDFLPQPIGGLLWIAKANVHLSPYLPCYGGSQGLTEAFTKGELGHYNPDSAWWVFQEVGQLCYQNYREIAKKEVIPVYRGMEKAMLARQGVLEKGFVTLYEKDPSLAGTAMRDYTTGCALLALDTAKGLTKKIKGKYLANVIIEA